ncbi:MAG: hypothetical protein M0P31_01560 [Solirubrobacteraceae bacterium]|nr:hypothetical protein [Solirubrobacteraceae bacterium]
MTLRRLFGPFFVVAGVLHFLVPRTYERAMPDYLPAHRELVYASGVAEIVGGAATMRPRTRRFGAWLSAATLLGVLPANVHMYQHPERFPEVPGGRRSLLLRLPFQLVFLAWALAAGRD